MKKTPKNMKLIHIFMSITKYQLTKMGAKYTLIRIDVYFSEYLLPVEIE